MEKSIISTGKTIDAATEAALERLGLDRDKVSVEVLETPRSGFFGIGATPAKIKVTYEAPDEPEQVQPAPALSSASRNVKPSQFAQLQAKKAEEARKAEEVRKAAEAAQRAVEEARKAEDARRAEQQPAAPKEESHREAQREPQREYQRDNRRRRPRSNHPAASRPASRAEELIEPREPKPRVPAEPLPPYQTPEPGSMEARIEAYLNGLLEKMGSDARAQAVKQSEERYHVELVGEHLGMLIGRRGDTLDALQHLTNYTIGRSESRHLRITVDAENYRAKREESLERLAYKVAARVLRYRRNWTMEPMNAYERHVIHAALQDYEGVSTFSTGTEPNRRVVVAYGDNAAAEHSSRQESRQEETES